MLPPSKNDTSVERACVFARACVRVLWCVLHTSPMQMSLHAVVHGLCSSVMAGIAADRRTSSRYHLTDAVQQVRPSDDSTWPILLGVR